MFYLLASILFSTVACETSNPCTLLVFRVCIDNIRVPGLENNHVSAYNSMEYIWLHPSFAHLKISLVVRVFTSVL